MPARCENQSGVGVVSVEGDLEESTATAARQAVQQMMDRRPIADFVVDLSRTPGVASEGLEMLLWLKDRCEVTGGRVVLCGCDTNLEKILEITRLRHRFEVADTLETGMRRLRV